MSDYYDGPVGINPFTRANAQDVTGNLQAIADAFGRLPALADLLKGGPAGPTGPAFSTFTSMTDLRNAPRSNQRYTLTTADDFADYKFVEGDFSGKDDGHGIIGLNGVPLWVGALQRVYFELVNVKDFGAKGNFIKDDTASIQAAIDYVFSRGGGFVLIPIGTYKVSLSNPAGMFQLVGIVMRPGVYLQGQNRRSIIKLNNDDSLAGPGAAIRIIASQPGLVDSSGVSDMVVDGNFRSQPKLAGQTGNGGNIVYGLFDNGSPSNITVHNNASLDAYGQGIQIVGQSDTPGFNIRVTENDVFDCTFIGIQCAQFIGLTISGNKIARTGDNGIDIYGFNNNFSAPAITSGNFLICDNQMQQCGGAGIFPETVKDGIVFNNIADGCVNGVQVNCIAGAMQGVIVVNNHSHDCQNGYAHTGPHDTHWINNYARGFTYGGFVLGTVGGEASFATYEGFRFKPASNIVPLVVAPDGVLAVNFNNPGVCHYLTQADTNNPTPRARWFFSTTATRIRSPTPVFSTATEDGPSSRHNSPVISGLIEYETPLQVFADNASALAALGPNRDYKRENDGPKYQTHA